MGEFFRRKLMEKDTPPSRFPHAIHWLWFCHPLAIDADSTGFQCGIRWLLMWISLASVPKFTGIGRAINGVGGSLRAVMPRPFIPMPVARHKLVPLPRMPLEQARGCFA